MPALVAPHDLHGGVLVLEQAPVETLVADRHRPRVAHDVLDLTEVSTEGDLLLVRQRLVGEDLPLSELAKHPKVIESVRSGLMSHNQQHPNAASRIARVKLQSTPPQSDSGEITEKGYINQNKAQTLRQADVDALYGTTYSGDVIIL